MMKEIAKKFAFFGCAITLNSGNFTVFQGERFIGMISINNANKFKEFDMLLKRIAL